jgi:hypothetical protein
MNGRTGRHEPLHGSSILIPNRLSVQVRSSAPGQGDYSLANESTRRIDLAFRQEIKPNLGLAGWRPQFIAYLYLGFTNATAFSPTDVMPLTPWAKITMAVQSTFSWPS